MVRPARSAPWLALILVAAALAGCLGGTTGAELDPTARGPGPRPYVPIDEDALSKPEFGILPAIDTRIAASIDGISLFAEVYLPDGEGPWPTILHSTPYKHLDTAASLVGGNGLVNTYVPRGYAVVLADVRGFGDSDGCVEVWGPNEQQDQYDLVEWIAAQEWSDGKVGMIGASYPGTTPIEAAVMAPPHLTTIVAQAGLTDPYFDWHFGGVPTGESGPAGSPSSYQSDSVLPPIEPMPDPLAFARTAADAGCGTPELVLGAWQQDSVYTDFYAARNFSARVKNINASVLFTHGFTDANVKPWQLVDFFNAMDAPKKGIFGQWAHQSPARADYEDLELAWFDHWLKGIENGVMEGPVAEVMTNLGTWRADDAFPRDDMPRVALHLDASDMALRFEAPTDDAQASFVALRAGRGDTRYTSIVAETLTAGSGSGVSLVFTSDVLDADLYLSGILHLDLNATMDAPNAYLMASLYEVTGGERTSIVYGGLAAALRGGYTKYEPVPEGERVEYRIRFQPREYIVEKGARLVLELYTLDATRTQTAEALGPTTIAVHTGPTAGSALWAPVLPERVDAPLPWE